MNEAELHAAARELGLDAIGAKPLWLGAPGAGSRLKLVITTWLLALTGGLGGGIALAEALDAPLLTRDRRLAAAAGHRAQIDLI